MSVPLPLRRALRRRLLLPFLLAGSFALTAGGMAWLLWWPVAERLAGAETAYQEARRAQSAQQALVESVQHAQRTWRTIPLRRDFPTVMVRLSHIAAEERVAIPGMTYGIESIPGSAAVKGQISFRATGDYRAIRRFLYRLETEPSSVFIESLSAARSTDASPGAGTRVSFMIKLAAYLWNDGAQAP